ncbi:hypothetical protein TNCV_2247851 [Trichonephila clavipes]|nr:hypothetical protein TNCV_2247851 [Trichonephila clavipes]
MSACEREFHIACMRSESSFFEVAGLRSRARRRPTKSQTCSIERKCDCRIRRTSVIYSLSTVIFDYTLLDNC